MKRLSMVLAAILVGNVAVAEEPVGVPEGIVKELRYLVGTWKFEGRFRDDVVAGTVSYGWVRGKERYGLVENWSYEEGDTSIMGTSLLGWNAAKECLVEAGFNSAGDCFLTLWKVESSREWRGEFSDVQEGQKVEGKGVVIKKGPAEFVYEGETTSGESGRFVFRKVAGVGLAALIPKGMRAFTIRTSNVAGFGLPGNRVDVLLTLKGKANDETVRGSTTTLLQSVEILAVDQELNAPAEKKMDANELRSVTLLVTPDQAAKLDVAQSHGTLTLSLRNPEGPGSGAPPTTLPDIRRYPR